MNYCDKFGFLSRNESFEFEGGKIEVIANFQKSEEWVKKHVNNDGYIYPPLVSNIERNGVSQLDSEALAAGRPAHVYSLPASHSLELFNGYYDVKSRDASYIVYLLGYIFGTRLQFHDWWFDVRVPIDSVRNVTTSKVVIEDFISKSYCCWKSWPLEKQKWFLSVLFMHSRVSSYVWEWERFMVEYTVFDGIYRLASKLYGCKERPSHEQRFNILFEKFGLKENEDKVKDIYQLRNDLFHQGIWDQGQPCNQRKDSNALYCQMNLSRINDRLITALLGYNTRYIETPWWTLSRCVFEADDS